MYTIKATFSGGFNSIIAAIISKEDLIVTLKGSFNSIMCCRLEQDHHGNIFREELNNSTFRTIVYL